MHTSHSCWKLLPDRSYERPLGAMETCFYWDSAFARTTDSIRCSEIKVIDGDLDKIIGLPNVLRSWTNVKKRFPLLGSRVYEGVDINDVFINVAEERLLTCQSNEISFHNVVSWEEAVHLADDMAKTENQVLSNDLQAQIIIARHQGRTDSFYFLFIISHIVTDGISNDTIIKTFLDELCVDISSVDRSSGFEERLALSVASEELNPAAARFNIARQRWRKAIAAILASKLTQRKVRTLFFIAFGTQFDLFDIFVGRVDTDYRRKYLKELSSLRRDLHIELLPYRRKYQHESSRIVETKESASVAHTP